MDNQHTKPYSIETREAWDTYKTGILPWSYRIGPNQPLQVVADAMQAELNDLRAAVAHHPAVAGSIAPCYPHGTLTPEADEFVRLMTVWRFADVGREAEQAFSAVASYINARLAPAAPSGEAVLYARAIDMARNDEHGVLTFGSAEDDWCIPLYTCPAPKEGTK
ncbi:MAG: hypothetical protein ACXW1D_00320 [Halobacteriota archaeon]